MTAQQLYSFALAALLELDGKLATVGGAGATLSTALGVVGAPVPLDGLLAQYFHDPYWETSVLVRQEHGLDYDWGGVIILDYQGELVFDGTPFPKFEPLSADKKAEAIGRIRAQRDSPDAQVRFRAWRSLFALEDEEAILHMLEDYRAADRDATQVIVSYGREWLIPYLVDDINHGSMESRGDERPIRIYSTGLAYAIIERSERFPLATRRWAAAFTIRGPSMRATPPRIGP